MKTLSPTDARGSTRGLAVDEGGVLVEELGAGGAEVRQGLGGRGAEDGGAASAAVGEDLAAQVDPDFTLGPESLTATVLSTEPIKPQITSESHTMRPEFVNY